MIGKMVNPLNNSVGKLNNDDSKTTKKNIYSKIAPPNSFKNRNTNKISPKIFQRYEKTIQSNQMNNPYTNYNSNYSKKSFISSNHLYNSNTDSNNKLSQNISSSFREKIKTTKENLINKSLNNNIISPKNIINEKIQNNNNNNNKLENNKYKTDSLYIIKHKSVYVKKGKKNILNNYSDGNKKIGKKSSNDIYINEFQLNDEDNFIKEKYDYLLKRTKNLLNNYQQIIDYYQEKEKQNKNEDNS